jgi:anti-sigma B factor antagonist
VAGTDLEAVTMASGEISRHGTAPGRTDVPGYVDFGLSVSVDEGVTVVRVSGDLDCYSAPQLRAALWALVADGHQEVVVDVGGTNFIDSTGLGVLVGGVRRLREGGGKLVLRSPNALTRRLFEITGVTKLFEIV